MNTGNAAVPFCSRRNEKASGQGWLIRIESISQMNELILNDNSKIVTLSSLGPVQFFDNQLVSYVHGEKGASV